MSNDIIGNISEGFRSLQLRKRKKNDYIKLEEGAYPRVFLQQLENDIAAVANDNLSTATMVRRNKRSGRLSIIMGYGPGKRWFKNDLIDRGHVLECATSDEALRALQVIKKAAEAGAFNEALEDLRIERQDHADKMIKARNVCGFHQKPDEEATTHVAIGSDSNEGESND